MRNSDPLTMWHPDPTIADLVVTAPTHAWLAVTVAAAGGHHLSLTGPPEAGKVLLARALHHLLPDSNVGAARLRHRPARHAQRSAPRTRPPWQQPHHTCSIASLVGSLTREGALSQAHQGVLFLDEAPEFSYRHLDAIAVAIAGCHVDIAQAGQRKRTPACAQLVLASRRCPCPSTQACGCSLGAQRSYQRRTLRLRRLTDLDITVDTAVDATVDAAPIGGIDCADYGLRSGPLEPVKTMVAAARRRRGRRPLASGPLVNSHADCTAMLHPAWDIPKTAKLRLRELIQRDTLTVANTLTVMRIAWTLTDLAGRDQPNDQDLATALLLHGPAR